MAPETKKPAAGGGAAGFSKRTEQQLGGGVLLFRQTSLGGGVGRLNSKLCGRRCVASMSSMYLFLPPNKQTTLQRSHAKTLHHCITNRIKEAETKTPASSAGVKQVNQSNRAISDRRMRERRSECQSGRCRGPVARESSYDPVRLPSDGTCANC